MAKFNFYVSTGYVNCQREEVVEIDDEYLEGLSEIETENAVAEVFEDWLWDNIQTNFGS